MSDDFIPTLDELETVPLRLLSVPEPAPSSGPPEIDPAEITLGPVIGDGAFGTVYRGKCRQKEVAVKLMLKKVDDEALEDFRKEVGICSKIFHPNIVLFLGATTTIPGKLMICTELMRCDLETLLYDSEVHLTMLTRMRMARDAALGMLWLHRSNPPIIHRDLKTSNLLVDNNNNVKVCDFGLSQIKPQGIDLRDGPQGAKGTPLWMAPEVLMHQEFNEKADVYSFGLILWSLLTRQEPYPEFDNIDDFVDTICYRGHRPVLPVCSPVLEGLIQACWAPDPAARPDMEHIVRTLYLVIIEEAIQDHLGADLWKQNFLDQDSVPWESFITAFCNVVHLSENAPRPMGEMLRLEAAQLPPTVQLNFLCFRAILTNEERPDYDQEALVKMEQFGSVLAWFGNLSEDGPNILEKIKRVLSCNWFHGDVSTHESENRLAVRQMGTFLVRFSTSERGNFTISKVSQRHAITHQRIHRDAFGAYEINGHTYPSLEALIGGESARLHLLYPATGSRFTQIFHQGPAAGYIN